MSKLDIKDQNILDNENPEIENHEISNKYKTIMVLHDDFVLMHLKFINLICQNEFSIESTFQCTESNDLINSLEEVCYYVINVNIEFVSSLLYILRKLSIICTNNYTYDIIY